MILVDSRTGSKEILPYIHRVGVKAELAPLEFGDFCFGGNGPSGELTVGIERKTLSDMLNCIDDARYSAHQLPGMAAMYNKSILIIEGVWKPDTESGYMMELIASMTWRPYRYRTQIVRYNKLFRYLLTVQFSGVTVLWCRDKEHSAFDICECYRWFQKPWDQHTSLLAMQKLNIPSLNGKPPLVQRWAAQLEGIGVKLSADALKLFKTPYDLAKSDEGDWMTIPGVGAKLAKRVIEEIHGQGD